MSDFQPIVWLNKLFDEFLKDKIKSVSSLKLATGSSCIINDPEFTMQNEYLGDHLEVCLETVKKVLMIPPSTRLKPLVVTVRGMGGGKTRLLEELRAATNLAPNTLALSITFNNKMSYSAQDEQFFIGSHMLRVNILLSILLRFAATVYDVSYSDFRIHMNTEVMNLDASMLKDEAEVVLFGRHFVCRILLDIDSSFRRDVPSVPMKDVLLFVDEVMAIPRSLQDMSIVAADMGVKAAVSIFSKAVLDEAFVIGDDHSPVNTCLTISSLEISVLDMTSSGRAISVLTVPERLDAGEIVRRWWCKQYLPTMHDTDLFRLRLIAETVNTQPRVVSLVPSILESKVDLKGRLLTGETPFMTGSFIAALYKDLLVNISERYCTITGDVSAEKLVSLVYGDKERLDSASAKMIERSYYTNSVQIVMENRVFKPVGSLMMLAGTSTAYSTVSAVDLLDPYDCFYALLTCTTEVIACSGSAEGASLEVVTEWWIKCRIATSKASGATSLKLGRLLPFFLGGEGELEIPVPMYSKYFVPWRTNQWPVLTDASVTVFAKAFNKTGNVLRSRSFIMYESRPGQGFDQLLSFLVTDPTHIDQKKAFLVFLDEKSYAVTESRKALDSSMSTEINCAQFERVQRLAAELSRLHAEEGLVLSLESQALVAGDFRFVYITTYASAGPTSTDEKVIVCDAEDTERFFGIMWPFVRAVRSPSR